MFEQIPGAETFDPEYGEVPRVEDMYAELFGQISERKRGPKLPTAEQMDEIAASLTQIEFEMLEMMIAGISNTKIGAELGLGGREGAVALQIGLANKLCVSRKHISSLAAELVSLVNQKVAGR